MLWTIVFLLVMFMMGFKIDAAPPSAGSESMLAISSKLANLCVSINRNTPGNFSVIECSPVKVTPPCYIIPGNSKLYFPDCCPKSSCGNSLKSKQLSSHSAKPNIQLTSTQMIQHGAINLFANGSLNQKSSTKSSTSSSGSSSKNVSSSSAQSSTSSTSSHIKTAHPRNNRPSVLGPSDSGTTFPEISSISGKTISSTGESDEPTRIAPKVIAPKVSHTNEHSTTSNYDSNSKTSGTPAQKMSNQSSFVSGAMKIAPGVINPKTNSTMKISNANTPAKSVKVSNISPPKVSERTANIPLQGASTPNNSKQSGGLISSNSKTGKKKKRKLTSSQKAEHKKEKLKKEKRKLEEKRQLERLEQMKLRKQQAALRKMQREQAKKKYALKHQKKMAAQQARCLAAMEQRQDNTTLLSGTNSTIPQQQLQQLQSQPTALPTSQLPPQSQQTTGGVQTPPIIKPLVKSDSRSSTGSATSSTKSSTGKNSSSDKNTSSGKDSSSGGKISGSKSDK